MKGETRKLHEPEVFQAIAELRARVAGAKKDGKSVGLVPTMGALHAGHISLVDAAERECDEVVVTIFVNPTQFGPSEDFAKYPRMLENDLKLLTRAKRVIVFAPEREEIYRDGDATKVVVSGVTEKWEGAIRPGHFSGVATIVLKLFNIVQPDMAFFGQKDYQQLQLIRRMTADLDLPIRIRMAPTVREPDGLAMSSRNAYLSPEERRRALVLSRALRTGAERFNAGERDAKDLTSAMLAVLAEESRVTLDYLAIVDAETLEPVERIDGGAVLLIAARVGATRLIDNWLLEGG